MRNPKYLINIGQILQINHISMIKIDLDLKKSKVALIFKKLRIRMITKFNTHH